MKMPTLFDSATAKGRIIRQGDIIQLVMDGSGAIVVSAQDFMVAQKWASTRLGSSNMVSDRGRFLEKLEVLVARPNSFVATRGSVKALEVLVRTMFQNGYDLKEWMLPIEFRDYGKPKLANKKATPVITQDGRAADDTDLSDTLTP